MAIARKTSSSATAGFAPAVTAMPTAAWLPWLTTRSLLAAPFLQAAGFAIGPDLGALGGILFALGLALAALGLGALAAARGRNLAWALFAVFFVVGPLVGWFMLGRRPPAPNAPLHAIRGAAHVVLFCTLFGLSYAWLGEGQSKPIHGEAPDGFPVLAVIRSGDGEASAFVVQKRDLARFAQEYPGFSYLVPRGLEQSLNKRLRYYAASGEFKLEEIEPPGYFKVKTLGVDRQRFEVRYPIHDEAHAIGWYDATAKGIEPRRYRFWHDFAHGMLGMFALVFAFLLYPLIAWLLNRYLWPRWRAPEP